MRMKIEPDDPRLTAYVLGELSPKEARQFDHAIAGDPALKLAVREIERAHADLLKFFGKESDKLLPRQRGAIMQAAREASGLDKVVDMKPQRKAVHIWTWPLAAAAVVTATLFIITMIPALDNGDSGKRAGNGADKAKFDEYVAVEPEGQVRKNIGLPIVAGSKSLNRITRSIREIGNLPSRHEVRIEEMLNAFPLDAKGSVALWKGASLGTEVVECPWSPSGSLVFVKIRGARARSVKLSVEFKSNEESVISSRLMGYEIEENPRDRKSMPQELSAGQETLVAFLVEAKSPELGQLSWSVDGVAAPDVELVRDGEKEASADGRFASLICGFGLWLRQENPSFLPKIAQSDAQSQVEPLSVQRDNYSSKSQDLSSGRSGRSPVMIDDSLILGLAREVAAESMVPDRYDFLELVDQAVKVKNK
jgi:hypothetical protein